MHLSLYTIVRGCTVQAVFGPQFADLELQPAGIWALGLGATGLEQLQLGFAPVLPLKEVPQGAFSVLYSGHFNSSSQQLLFSSFSGGSHWSATLGGALSHFFSSGGG